MNPFFCRKEVGITVSLTSHFFLINVLIAQAEMCFHSELLLLSLSGCSAAHVSNSAITCFCSSTVLRALFSSRFGSQSKDGLVEVKQKCWGETGTHKSLAKPGTSAGQLTLPRRIRALCLVASLIRISDLCQIVLHRRVEKEG